MRERNQYRGIKVTDKFVTVYFVQTTGLTVRFSEVKVPIRALLDEEVTACMDRAVRQDLMRLWAADDLEAAQAQLDLG